MCYITSVSAEERQTFSVCVVRAWPWTSVIRASSDVETLFWRWGQERMWVCAKAWLIPTRLFFFFFNLNVNRAQRAPALGCLSPHCLLNHWGTIGLWMHEEVLSAGTLEKAFKKNIQPSMTWAFHLQECKYTSASVQDASVSPWSKSSCQRKAYSSQIWFQRCFCCCINPLFVLNLTYAHSCSYPPPHPSLWWEGGDAHGELAWPFKCSHAWLKPMVKVDPSAQPEKMFCLHLWLEGECELVRIGRFLASLIEASLSHGYHKPETCVLLNMKQVSCRPNDWCKEMGKKENKKAGKLSTCDNCLLIFLALN